MLMNQLPTEVDDMIEGRPHGLARLFPVAGFYSRA